MVESVTVANPEVIDVGMSEWAVSENDGIIETYGLGLCIGVAIYDSRLRVGYLAHTASYLFPPAGYTDGLSNMLEAVKDRGGQPADLKVWIGGGRLGGELFPQPEYNKMLLTKRSQYLARLAELGIPGSQIEVHWNGPLESLAMALDCSTGECTLEVSQLTSSL